MIKQLFILVIALTLFVGSSEAKETRLQCSVKCLTKTLSKTRRQCKQVLSTRKLHKCRVVRLSPVCSRKCKSGYKRCWKHCSMKTCGGRKVKVCKTKCYRGRKCFNVCLRKKQRQCFIDNQKYFRTICKNILSKKKFKTCQRQCIKVVPKCTHLCRSVRVRRKYRKCSKILIKSAYNKRKCSFKRNIQVCQKKCIKNKKVCSKTCRAFMCAGKRILKCKVKCHTGNSCMNNCAWRKQKRCVLSRIPAKYVKRCGFYFAFRGVRRCFKRCLYQRKLKPVPKPKPELVKPKGEKKCMVGFEKKGSLCLKKHPKHQVKCLSGFYRRGNHCIKKRTHHGCKKVYVQAWNRRRFKVCVSKGETKVVHQSRMFKTTSKCKHSRSVVSVQRNQKGEIRVMYLNRCSKGWTYGKWSHHYSTAHANSASL
eukprot:gene2552-3514_t